MRVFYKTDRIYQLDNVEEIIIKEGTIKFVIVKHLLEEEIYLQDFYFVRGKKGVKVNIIMTDGRVETLLNSNYDELTRFVVPDFKSYLLGHSHILKETTQSIYIEENKMHIPRINQDKLLSKLLGKV